MHSDRRGGGGLPPLGNGVAAFPLPNCRSDPVALTLVPVTAPGDMTPVHLPRRLVFDSAERTAVDSSPYVSNQSPSSSGVLVPPPSGPPPPPWSQSQLNDTEKAHSAAVAPSPTPALGQGTLPPRPPVVDTIRGAEPDGHLHQFSAGGMPSHTTPHRTPNGNGTGGLQLGGGSGQNSSLSNSGKELSEVQRALKEVQRGADAAGETICSSLDRWLQLLAPLKDTLALDPSLPLLVKDRQYQGLADLYTKHSKLISSTTDRALCLVENIREAEGLRRTVSEAEEIIDKEKEVLNATAAAITKLDAQLSLSPPTAGSGHHPHHKGETWPDNFARVEGDVRSELLAGQQDWGHSCDNAARLLSNTIAAEKRIKELTSLTDERSTSLSQEGRRLSQSRTIALVSLEESDRFSIMDDESQAALLLWDNVAQSIGVSIQAFDVNPSQSLESEVAHLQQKCDAAVAELESKRQVLQGLSRQLQAFHDEEALRHGQKGQGKPQLSTLPAEWTAAFRRMGPEERENHLNQWRDKVREIQESIALRPRRPPPGTPYRAGQTPSKVDKDDVELFETLDKLQSQVLHLSAELAQIQREQQRCEGYQSIELYHDAQKALLDLHTSTINPLRAELSGLEQESKEIKKVSASREVERASLMQTEASRRQAVDAKRSTKYALEDDIQQLEGSLNGLQSRRDQYLQKKKFYFAQMSRPDYMQLPSRIRRQLPGASTEEELHRVDHPISVESWDRDEAADVDQSIEIVDGSPVAKVRGPWSGSREMDRSSGADTGASNRDGGGRQWSRRLDTQEASPRGSSASVIYGAAAWLGSTVVSFWSKKSK